SQCKRGLYDSSRAFRNAKAIADAECGRGRLARKTILPELVQRFPVQSGQRCQRWLHGIRHVSLQEIHTIPLPLPSTVKCFHRRMRVDICSECGQSSGSPGVVARWPKIKAQQKKAA